MQVALSLSRPKTCQGKLPVTAQLMTDTTHFSSKRSHQTLTTQPGKIPHRKTRLSGLEKALQVQKDTKNPPPRDHISHPNLTDKSHRHR